MFPEPPTESSGDQQSLSSNARNPSPGIPGRRVSSCPEPATGRSSELVPTNVTKQTDELSTPTKAKSTTTARPASKKPRDQRHPLGRWGERFAAIYLTAIGYRVVAKNLRTPQGEIDLLAIDRWRGTRVIVEVKTRRDLRPAEIRFSQRQRLARAAIWLHGQAAKRAASSPPAKSMGLRIDVIEVRWPRRWVPWPKPWPQLKHRKAVWGEEEAGLS